MFEAATPRSATCTVWSIFGSRTGLRSGQYSKRKPGRSAEDWPPASSDRTALVANEVEGANTAALAAEFGSTPGAVAAQLARARAKLRVNYLLAIRGVDLPTDRCQPVLNALSAGDRRRQRTLDAGGHLLDCEVCAGLSDPLTERRRALAGFLPLGLVKPVEGLRGWLRDHPGQATAGTGAVVVGAFLATQLLAAEPTAVQPITPAPTTSRRRRDGDAR